MLKKNMGLYKLGMVECELLYNESIEMQLILVSLCPLWC